MLLVLLFPLLLFPLSLPTFGSRLVVETAGDTSLGAEHIVRGLWRGRGGRCPSGKSLGDVPSRLTGEWRFEGLPHVGRTSTVPSPPPKAPGGGGGGGEGRKPIFLSPLRACNRSPWV